MKVGVVGVGNMGFHHARIYAELSRDGIVEFLGVADLNFERAKEVAKKFGVSAFSDYRDLLGVLDAVSIAVPTKLHYDVSMDFIRHGVNVLVEKPISDSVEKAREMVRAAEIEGVKLMVGHVERFNPAVLKLKELIDRGKIRDLITMSARRLGPFNPSASETGVIIDLAIHDIDIMCFLTESEVEEVYARCRRVLGSSEDYALINLKFRNFDGVVETNRLTRHKVRNLSVVSLNGLFQLDYIQQEITAFQEDGIKKVDVQKREPLRGEIESFIECIERDKKPPVDGEVGLYALIVATEALESSRRNEVLKVIR
jgi:UDP-N-acetylglucosamine 3-dehydrogenase